MRHLLNTLFVTTEGAYLAKDGQCVAVRVENQTRLRLPIHTVGQIVCYGRVSCSPPLMGFCGEKGVGLCFMSSSGRFLASVQGPVRGNVLLRRQQYRWADDDGGSAAIAAAVVAGKVANARTVLLLARRDHIDQPDGHPLHLAAERMADALRCLQQPGPTTDVVRGIEGDAARAYFGVFDHLVTSQKQDFFMRERSRRPPLDNLNALLSFLYALLVREATWALETVGLDPCVGFLHRDRPGRPSLALDLMEELRPVIADRLALSLVNRRQVAGDGFRRTESGGVLMDDATRKTVLVAWQKRKQEEITHPFINEKMPVGLLPVVQAQLLARHLRGDLDGYPPFIWK